MKHINGVILICGLINGATITGCARNIVYTDRAPHADADVVSVVYDRVGDLYPEPSITIAESLFRRRSGPTTLTLRGHFAAMRVAADPSWDDLLTSAGVRGGDRSFAAIWDEVQDTLRTRAIRSVQNRTVPTAGKPRMLFVVVHGFNNDMEAASKWYSIVRDTVRDRIRNQAGNVGTPPMPVFLEVYWDGLTATVPPAIWANAQYNFPLVGLELRRVLNRLPRQVPLRVFTHSSGGPLFASTLGDASAPLKNIDAAFDRYFSHVGDTIGKYAPPSMSDVRVAMIVPAASRTTFAGFAGRPMMADHLIIGINPSDVAITKGGFGCVILGSTCLSAERMAFCTHVAPKLRDSPRLTLSVFDFSNPRGFWFVAHKVDAYLARPDMGKILTLLLEDRPTVTDDSRTLCRR